MICQWILYTLASLTIEICGIGFNIINIVVFVKQGFKDTVNISLLGLAVSDICSLLPLIWTNICFSPAFMTADLPFDPTEFQYLTGGMFHTVFTRITGWITAFITLEKCLCITMPLQVKAILTSKRVSIITVFIFILLLSTVTPDYVAHKLDWKYYPDRNKTLIGLVMEENHETLRKISYVINNVLLPYSSFVVIIVCTIVLVFALQNNTKWRKSSTATGQNDISSKRNQKVSRMVVVISTLFIICFIPACLLFLTLSLEPQFFLDGKYKNLCLVLSGIAIMLESANSSGNIFIYYHMSAKYRLTFQQLFVGCRQAASDSFENTKESQ